MRITEKIEGGRILVSDGAWGTILQSKGLPLGTCPELWNLTHRETVLGVAKSYIDAGADVVKTNSFGANRFKLPHYGLQHSTYELNRTAAAISREAAGVDRFVMGCIGPSGRLAMMGEITEDEMYEAFSMQAMALAAGGADAILVETMTDLLEAFIAVKAAKENTRCEVFCTMSFDLVASDNYRTIMGVSPGDMIETMLDAGADAVGVNCGGGMSQMTGVVKQIRKINGSIPVVVHANAGIPHYADGKTVYPDTPAIMASVAEQLISAGANIIGGCCGTTPEHIRELASVISLFNNKVNHYEDQRI